MRDDAPLDSRRFADLVAEAKEIIAARCPGWTDLNPGDPGMTLVEVYAWLTETMLQIELTKGPKNSAAALEDVFCPFCRSPLLDAETTVDDLVACLKCGAPHHRECWDENATCSVFGCEARVDECKALQR